MNGFVPCVFLFPHSSKITQGFICGKRQAGDASLPYESSI
jgi:hypothetical protein